MFVILCVLGVGWRLRPSEDALTRSVYEVLKARGGDFEKIGVTIEGRMVKLEPNGASNAVVAEAINLIGDDQRVNGGWTSIFNPIVAVVGPESQQSSTASIAVENDNTVSQVHWPAKGPVIPPGWVLLCASPGNVVLRGVVSSEAEKSRILDELRNKWAVQSPRGDLEVTGGLAAVPDLNKFCRELGRFSSSNANHIILSALTTGEWMQLPPNADDLAVAHALHGAGLALADIEDLAGMWTQENPQRTKPLPVSRLVLAANARVGSPSVHQGLIQSAPSVLQTSLPDMPKSLPRARLIGPPYIGWAISKDEVLLTGAVLTESQKVSLVESADRLFGGRVIKSHLLEVDPSRQTPPGQPLELPKRLSSSAIGLCVAGSGVHTFPAEAMDREIVMSIPGLGVTKDQVGQWLAEYRLTRIANGEIKSDEPYLAVVMTDHSMLVSGAVGSSSARQSLLQKLASVASGRQLVDRLMVEPSIGDDPSLIVVLQRVPPVPRGDSAVFCLRPGQVARRGILHSVYTSEETGRSIDYDRATKQLRELLQWLPNTEIEVIGHTDTSNSLAISDRKGYEAARRCAEWLEQDLLLTSGAIQVRSAGPREPIAENATPEGRAVNRRVDLVVTRLRE